MSTLLTIIHVVTCVFLIIVVLLQAGKGGGMGIAFGGGGSQTVFGSSGAGNFLTRLTAIFAGLFMITSLGLARLSSAQDSTRLQQLAEKKAAAKKAEDERKDKVKTDIEKAREAIEKATGLNVAAPPDGAPPPPSAEIDGVKLDMPPVPPAPKPGDAPKPSSATTKPEGDAAGAAGPGSSKPAPAPPESLRKKKKPAKEPAAAPDENATP